MALAALRRGDPGVREQRVTQARVTRTQRAPELPARVVTGPERAQPGIVLVVVGRALRHLSAPYTRTGRPQAAVGCPRGAQAPYSRAAVAVRRPGAAPLLGALVSLVSLAAVVWWISGQEPPRLPDSSSGYAWLALALALIGCNFALRGWRWHRIMINAGVQHRRRDAFGLTLSATWATTCCPCAAAS